MNPTSYKYFVRRMFGPPWSSVRRDLPNLSHTNPTAKPIRPCHKEAILPRGPKKLCFTTLSLISMVSIARLSVVKQSSFGLPGQYDRRVTRVNYVSLGSQETLSAVYLEQRQDFCPICVIPFFSVSNLTKFLIAV